MNFKPTIVSVDQLISISKGTPIVRINGQPYLSRYQLNGKPMPYYGGFIKRLIAAGYILLDKGMVVRYSEDMFKPDEIQTRRFE